MRAGDHVANDQRKSADARDGSGDGLGPRSGVSKLVGAALRLGCPRTLACADLRLAAAGLRLGAPRDISLGGVTTYHHPNLREDYLRYFVFWFLRGTSFDGVCAACFRFSRTGAPDCRLVHSTHPGKISKQPGSLDRADRGRVVSCRRGPATPL